MTFTVNLTTDQLDTLRSEMSVLMPDIVVEYESDQLRIISDDPATAERLAMDALKQIGVIVPDEPTAPFIDWREILRKQEKEQRQRLQQEREQMAAIRAKRRRQSGVQVHRGVGL